MAVNKFSILFVKSASAKRSKTKKCNARHLMGWDGFNGSQRVECKTAEAPKKFQISEFEIANWDMGYGPWAMGYGN